MAAPFGPPPSRATTWIFPSGVTRESVRRSISTRTTEPSGIATGPSGKRRPDAICLYAGVNAVIAILPSSLHARELELVGAVTADEMGGRDLLPCRRLGPAHLDRERAARVEIAAARGRGGVRHLALQHDAPRAWAGVRFRSGGQERRRIGGLWSREELFGLRQLHDGAHVHHGHAGADVA